MIDDEEPQPKPGPREASPLRPPELRLLDAGHAASGALVHIGGYLSAEDDEPSELEAWLLGYRRAGWTGNIYTLWWDAYSVGDLLRQALHPGLVLPALGGLFGLAGSLALSAAKIEDQWSEAKRRADHAGGLPAWTALLALDEPWIDLSSYSLGARVVYRLLHQPGVAELRLRHALLHGGAISATLDWAGGCAALQGQLLNVHNHFDAVLNTAYRVSEGDALAVGLQPIPGEEPRVRNVDASPVLGRNPANHWSYKDHLPELLAPLALPLGDDAAGPGAISTK